VPFLYLINKFIMIIFNTIKKAEHYVKWYSNQFDYEQRGYDWSYQQTYISGDLIIVRRAGDGCGCGCDLHLYDYTTVIGRIKDKRSKTLNQILGK
jgi:hypothetical protein